VIFLIIIGYDIPVVWKQAIASPIQER